MAHRRQKRLTPKSNYECALRTRHILVCDLFSEREKQIAEKWFIEGKNPRVIADEKVIRGKRGFLSEDMIGLIIQKLYKGLIVYDEKPTKAKRVKDSEHMKRIWKLRKLIITSESVCQLCGSTEDLEVDHIIPYALGGTDDKSNLQILCHRCHADKTNQEAEQYGWRTPVHLIKKETETK